MRLGGLFACVTCDRAIRRRWKQKLKHKNCKRKLQTINSNANMACLLRRFRLIHTLITDSPAPLLRSFVCTGALAAPPPAPSEPAISDDHHCWRISHNFWVNQRSKRNSTSVVSVCQRLEVNQNKSAFTPPFQSYWSVVIIIFLQRPLFNFFPIFHLWKF